MLILGGPTASGKTDLAIALAERYDAEIVGADSRQIYRDMPIGTAAPTPEQRGRIPHYLVDFVDPYERYSAARYVEDAAAAIEAIHTRGKHAIVTGGTGFYVRALCGDVDLALEPDPVVRARLQHETLIHPVEVLHDWLTACDPRRGAQISPRDPYRIVRALEVRLMRAARSVDERQRRRLPTLRASGTPYVKLALHVEPNVLAERIARRTDAMLAGGFVAEAERIGAAAVASDAVGYRQALAYTAGQLSWDELRATLTRATRRYGKRQVTWFRAEPEIRWIESGDIGAAAAAADTLGWRARL